MNITIVGTGYVGLITGTVFAYLGHNVMCVDVDKEKIANLSNGIIPIYEPGLDELIKECIIKGRLHFTTDLSLVANNSSVVFSAVGTPPDDDGSADLKYVLQVAKTFGETITHYNVLVTKSTVPVGTADKVKKVIQDELDKRGMNIAFDVVSNPEFLKEGSAITDCLNPDRIVIGYESERAKKVMQDAYSYFIEKGYPILYTDIRSAEMIKYASNSMLATRISFMNEIANLCEKVGANIDEVSEGMGYDKRIGKYFLKAGCGYGGSCFPKDVKALINTGLINKCYMNILSQVESTNSMQKLVLVKKLLRYYHNHIAKKNIAIWGASFKPNTDDMRESPTIVIVKELLKEKVNSIKIYDPVALNECKRILGSDIICADSTYDAVTDADALLIVTDWDEFKMTDMKKVKNLMKVPVIFDGRNIFDVTPNGFEYYPIGKAVS